MRRTASRLKRSAIGVGRRTGVLPYQPERWTTDQWTHAYGAGTLDYYAQLDELARYSVIVGYVSWFVEATARRPSILDVGCGNGLLRRRLADDLFSDYVGIDLSPAAIERADAEMYARSRFIVGDVASTDVGSFDIVILNEVLYYAAEPSVFLERLQRTHPVDRLLLVSMWRHPGDRSLWRTLHKAYPIFDRVEVRNRSNPINRKGWLVAACGASGLARAARHGTQS